MWRGWFVTFLLATLWGCGSADRSQIYEVRGQVLGLRSDVREVLVAHEEIPGYMPAMTMSFGVKDTRLLEGLAPGDLVRASLTVTDSDAWLTSLEKTGHADIVERDEEAASALPASTLLDVGDAVPDESFVDQDGRPFSLASVRGQAVALTFVYTRCPMPTFCPVMDRQFRAAQQLVAARADLRGRVQFLTVTFDPSHDTPDVLRAHAAAIGADLTSWRFLTADESATGRFATQFGVAVIRESDDAADITHNLRTAVIGPDGRVRRLISGTEWTPRELVQELAAAATS